MADPVTWQTVAQSVLPGAIGGVIGAGSALYGAKKAGDRDREARTEQASRDRVQRRESALNQSLLTLIDTHTATLGPAIRARAALADTVPHAEWEEADASFEIVHVAAVRAQEGLRVLTRSRPVEDALEDLRKHQGEVYELARGKAPKGLTSAEASRKTRGLLRAVSDEVKAESDALWTALPSGGRDTSNG